MERGLAGRGAKSFRLGGWGGCGKAALVRGLIPGLGRGNFGHSAPEHGEHGFGGDKPGKGSYEPRQAGATEVMVASANRWALMHELREEAEPASTDLIRYMTPVDLLLIEGFKTEAHDKLEIHRPALGRPPLYPGDRHIVAVASDRDIEGLHLPRLDLNDAEAIANFIIAHCGREKVARQ